MKRWFFLLSAFASLCFLPLSVLAQDFDPNQPIEEIDQSSAVHPYIEVDGQQVFYYYDDQGAPRYYRLLDGVRVYYAADWWPFYLEGGLRVYFRPTPFIWVGGRPVYYYNDGSLTRYYYRRNGSNIYLSLGWRPYRYSSGVRTYYTPRVRYSRSTWARVSVRYRPLYRPTYVRTRYRYAPVRRPIVRHPVRVVPSRHPVRVIPSRYPVRVVPSRYPVRVIPSRHPVRPPVHRGRR